MALASVIRIGTEDTVNTTVVNVILVVMDVKVHQILTVAVVYQMPSVMVTEIVSVNQASGR